MAKPLHYWSEFKMIQLHIFTEEESFKIFLDNFLPKIIPPDISYFIHPHQGKQNLEKAIRTTVPSISKIPGSRILITRDQDSGDCKFVKQEPERIIHGNVQSPYYIRIICRELECWYLGDLSCIEKIYPRFNSSKYRNKKTFRNPDLVQNSSKLICQIVPELKDRDYLPKIQTASKMGKCLCTESNNSTSFRQFTSAIKDLIEIK